MHSSVHSFRAAICAFLLAACTGSYDDSNAASVDMTLLIGDVEVSEIRYRVEEGTTLVAAGTLEVGALSGTRVRARIGQLLAGGPYSLVGALERASTS